MPNWLRSYGLLMRWTILRRRLDLPLTMILQILVSAGVVIGYSLLIPELDARSALYLATGAMTLSLLTVTVVIAPQMIAQQKLQGILDYQRSLPVPRTAALAADITVWVAIALPGAIVALVIAVLRFGLSVAMSPWVVPAVILVAAAAIGVGYCIAYAVKAALVGIVTNAVLIGSLMFAPINYPADRLPRWLDAVHAVLPFAPMARIIRDTVQVPAGGVALEPFAVVAVWAIAGVTLASRMMTRRE